VDSMRDFPKISRRFLQSLGVTEANAKGWEQSVQVNLSLDQPMKVFGMPFHIPANLRDVTEWNYWFEDRSDKSGAFGINDSILGMWFSSPPMPGSLASIPSDLRSLSLIVGSDSTLLKKIPGIHQIEALSLAGSELQNLDALEGCIRLEYLDLSQCHSLSDLNGLRNLTRLKRLNLFWCRSLLDLSILKALPNLTHLKLGLLEFPIDLRILEGLLNLGELNLCGCRLASDLSPLAGLKNLQSLQLSSCGEIRSIECLRGCISLETLECDFKPEVVNELLADIANWRKGIL